MTPFVTPLQSNYWASFDMFNKALIINKKMKNIGFGSVFYVLFTGRIDYLGNICLEWQD
tara:strand:+ start:68 stop:244 length:177 start_codon:yes stop_codon:yes gene_type:complete